MATATRKRKAARGLEESTKRLRIEEPSPIQLQQPIPSAHTSTKFETENGRSEFGKEDTEDNHRPKGDSSSDEEQTADTPATPFSPGRKKFPSELKTIKCTYEGCTKTFNRPARLVAHLRSHTNERPYVCTYEGCDKAYLTDKHLKTHIKGSHTHERSYHCDWDGCDKNFLTSTRLKRHREAHEGRDRFRCTGYPPCNQTFRKHQTLQRHIRSDHLELAPYPCTYIDPFTSEPCNAGFDGAVGLRKHEEKVHGMAQHFCPECTVSGAFAEDGTPIHLGFTNNAQLQAHVKKEHANCMFCDLKCSSQRELQNHIDTQHSRTTLEERKKIVCTYAGCNKKFTKPGNLKIHIRTAHEGQRFICGSFDVSSYPDVAAFESSSSCGNDFISKASLVDHIRTAHLGLPSVVNGNRTKSEVSSDIEMDPENNYEKPKRPKKKSKKPRASELDHLLGISYNADPDRNISCLVPDCPYRFIRDYDLQVHMRSAHRDMHPDPGEAFSAFEGAFQFPEGYDEPLQGTNGEVQGELRDAMTSFYDQADLDWELQRRALEGGPFWVGADEVENDFGVGQDEWTQEEMEMRRLVGGGDFLSF